MRTGVAAGQPAGRSGGEAVTRKGRLGNAPGEDVTLTPPEIWERLGQVPDQGKALFDPCPHPRPEADALEGEIWDPGFRNVGYLNAPFSDLYPWQRKAVRSAMAGHPFISLVPARTSQPMWRCLASAASMIAFWCGTENERGPGYLSRRVRFLSKDGSRMAGAPFDTVLFLLSDDLFYRERFERAFSDVATVVALRPHRNRGPM